MTNARYVKNLTSDLGDVNARHVKDMMSSLDDTDTGNYVVVELEFINGAKEATTIEDLLPSLLDGQGRKSITGYQNAPPDYVEPPNNIYDPSKDFFQYLVKPGATQQAEIVYSVAPDAKDFTLQLFDVDRFSHKNANVKLGF